MFYIIARTNKTLWVKVDETETMEQARRIAREILDKDSSVEIAIDEAEPTEF